MSANFKLLGKLQLKTASDHILLNIGLQISDVLFKILAGILLYAFLDLELWSHFPFPLREYL